MHNHNESVRAKVMETIQKGEVRMRPRWHFLLISALALAAAFIVLFALAYVVSLVVFFLRESGAWFLPGFGGRGWFDFFRSLPWLVVALLGVFVFVLEVLVRRHAFVYKKSLLVSALGIVLVICAGGFVIAQTSLHRGLAFLARSGQLPPPIRQWYRPPFRMHPDDVYRGVILSIHKDGFTIADYGAGTTTVVITPQTRLPEGADFVPGDMVVVIGDRSAATDTVSAFGVREVEKEPELQQ
jgi:hypothetical protein